MSISLSVICSKPLTACEPHMVPSHPGLLWQRTFYRGYARNLFWWALQQVLAIIIELQLLKRDRNYEARIQVRAQVRHSVIEIIENLGHGCNGNMHIN